MSLNAAPSGSTPTITGSAWLTATSPQQREQLIDATRQRIATTIRSEQAKVEEAEQIYPTNRQPLTVLEGPARAAKLLVESKLRKALDDAALPVAVRQHRQAFQYVATGPQRNIFDAFDPADRKLGGMPIDPTTAYFWAAGRDDVVSACRTAGLRADDPAWKWFEGEVKNRVFADQTLVRLLTLMDRFSFAKTGPHGTLWIGSLAWNYPDHPAGFGVRHLRWKAFFLSVHEYIHTLEHPIFTVVKKFNPATMEEGFCEIISRDLCHEFQDHAGDPGYDEIRRLVEGVPTDKPAPAADPEFMTVNYDSKPYDSDVTFISGLTMHGARIPQRRLRSCFLQGHVEYYNFTPTGDFLPGDPDGPDEIGVPAACTTLAELATFTGVEQKVITVANPNRTLTPLPRRLTVPGWQEHHVVTADGQTETMAQIAGQHGLNPDRIRQVNALAPTAEPKPGAVLLVPSSP